MDSHKPGQEDGRDRLPERPATSGVRRVNNMPLLLVGGVLAIFAILIALVANNRAAKNSAVDEGVRGNETPSSAAAAVLQGNGEAGFVPDQTEPSLPSLPVATIDAPPLPDPVPGQAPPAGDPLLAQMLVARMTRLQAAIGARTEIARVQPKQPAAVAGDAAAHAATGASTAAADTPPELPGSAGPKPDNSYRQFDRPGGEDRWRLEATLEKPRTPYELRAGFVIPATLISGVNSDLPGQITAQVSQDVYDTATGAFRLIPQGTRLVGTYNANVAYGQSRVLIAWQRLVFPDGRAMDIGSMPGADSAGFSGFADKVNNHYLRIFGSALLMSGVVAGINSSQTSPENDPFGSSTNTLLSQAIAQQMGEVATELVRKNMNISPTVEIRPGYRFNVMVVKDLTFGKPYRAFDY